MEKKKKRERKKERKGEEINQRLTGLTCIQTQTLTIRDSSTCDRRQPRGRSVLDNKPLVSAERNMVGPVHTEVTDGHVRVSYYCV